MKRYGDTKTNLKLTKEAQEIYSNSDNLDIWEQENGLYTLNLFGDIRENLSEQEVNDLITEPMETI